MVSDMDGVNGATLRSNKSYIVRLLADFYFFLSMTYGENRKENAPL